MIQKRSRSTSRYARKRTKYSRSTAARKIQALYRRRRPAMKKRNAVGRKMMTQKVGRWLQFAKGEDTSTGMQQQLYGINITFPKASADLDSLITKVTFENGIRNKTKIKLGGMRVQAIIENCYTVPIEFNYMVVQNTRPDPLQNWPDLKADFWIKHAAEQDNSPNFTDQQVAWDPNMAFSRIRQERFKILMHAKKLLLPQATQHALNNEGAITAPGPTVSVLSYGTNGLSTINEKNVMKIDRYLQMNKMMSFERTADDRPYYPLHIIWWCTVRQPALFDVASNNDLFCVNQRNTLFWNE